VIASFDDGVVLVLLVLLERILLSAGVLFLCCFELPLIFSCSVFSVVI
jgi:hypothetical protein